MLGIKKSIVLERSIFQVKLAMGAVLQVPILLHGQMQAKRYRLHGVQYQGRCLRCLRCVGFTVMGSELKVAIRKVKGGNLGSGTDCMGCSTRAAAHNSTMMC